MVEHVGHGHDPRLFQFRDGNHPAEWFFGLFASAGIGVTYTDVPIGGRTIPGITIAGELQYTHDWFELGSFAAGDDGLSTLTPMITFAVGF